MKKRTGIYCAECEQEVVAALTYGDEIYPFNAKMRKIPFWICDTCHNYVGCHYKTKNKTKPLGIIPTAEMRRLRKQIHKIIDPLWKDGLTSRSNIYSAISKRLGYEYHTAETRTVDELLAVIDIAREIENHLKRK